MTINHLQGFTATTGYLQMSRSLGRSLLKRAGFIDCVNPAYLEKDGIFAHYNKIVGMWIVENAKNVNGLLTI
jgi:hypothetical protein